MISSDDPRETLVSQILAEIENRLRLVTNSHRRSERKHSVRVLRSSMSEVKLSFHLGQLNFLSDHYLPRVFQEKDKSQCRKLAEAVSFEACRWVRRETRMEEGLWYECCWKLCLLAYSTKADGLEKGLKMSLLLKEEMNGRVIEVTVSGTLTKEAYQQFVPTIEAAIEKYKKVRVIFVMLGFHGWNAGALWEDVKFDLKHFNHIERLAIVGESKWEQGMALFCRPFTTAKIQYFDHAKLEQAREWIKE